jgi:ArsR family metal-binding transcriptional regulator
MRKTKEKDEAFQIMANESAKDQVSLAMNKSQDPSIQVSKSAVVPMTEIENRFEIQYDL